MSMGKALVTVGLVYYLLVASICALYWYNTQGWTHFLDVY